MDHRLFNRLKRYLSRSRLYVLGTEVKWRTVDCWKRLDRLHLDRAVVSLSPTGPPKGAVLLSYFIDPFLDPASPTVHGHPQYWVSAQIARHFLDLGYAVDVISYRNQAFHPDRAYDVVIDARHNMERLRSCVPERCLKIFLIDSANILFHNAAEARRLLALQQRRGTTLPARRYERPNRGIEFADCGVMFGNEFTLSTFRYAGRPLYRVPIPCQTTYAWPEDKRWDQVRRSFVFFSSGGMVHKGLDLVLEAFAGMPDYGLTVCGPVEEEEDFCAAYRKELFETSNIRTLGWVDVQGRGFLDMAHSSIGLVYPSCSEGGASAALTCMQTGLIPIVSYESSVDMLDFGLQLKQCTVEDIREAASTLASLPTALLERRARETWQYARAHFTRERFAEEFGRLMAVLLDLPAEHLSYDRLTTRSPEREPVRLLHGNPRSRHAAE